ncbi:MAG: DUF4340 domain-containing protein [Planctomycetota bacterium]
MKRGTILLLAVVVGTLLWLRGVRKEEAADFAAATPEVLAVPDLLPERARVLSIDHLQRGVQVRLERDTAGIWHLTAPLAYPADGALVRTLLEQIAAARGAPVPEPDLAALALAEPLVVIEVGEVREEGERTWRVELGGLDLDERLVHARVPGHPRSPAGRGAAVLRISRSLFTTVDRAPDDYRDPRVSSLPAGSVTALVRRGALASPGGGAADLGLEARRTGEVWRRTDPPAVRLDARVMGSVVHAAAGLRAWRYVDDSPASLSPYGLDEPAFTIALTGDRGRTETLRFAARAAAAGPGPVPGPPAAEVARWYAMREGFPHVWEVRGADLQLLVSPPDLLVDSRILHALREDVRRVELASPGRVLRLEREGEGWQVAEARDGGPEARFPADSGAVEDVLATLEQAELGDVPADAALAVESGTSITIACEGGEVFGGAVGAAWQDPATGRAGRAWRRHGDAMIQLVEEKVAALCSLPIDRLRSLVLLDVSEFLVDRVRVQHAGAIHLYVRREKEWLEGTSQMTLPLDVQILIGDLCRIEAVEWLAPERAADRREEIAVELQGRFPAGTRTLVLARDARGAALCILESGEAARIAPELSARLLALFGREEE